MGWREKGGGVREKGKKRGGGGRLNANKGNSFLCKYLKYTDAKTETKHFST